MALSKNQLAALSDRELFFALCSEQNDGDIFEEFARRFLPSLIEECERQCRHRKLDNDIGNRIACDTLEKARKYKSFDKDEINVQNDRESVLVYLFRIATNLFNDHHRKEKKAAEGFVPNKTYFDDLYQQALSTQDSGSLLDIRQKTEILLKQLNAKEKKVVLKDLEYKRHQKYLPDTVLEELSTELNVKPDTIRKIRERAISKLKKGINEINKTS